MGIGEEIYSGTASFGRVMAVISAVIVTILALVFIGMGIYILVKKEKDSVTGTVLSADCDPYGSDNRRYNCVLKVSYEIDNVVYSKTVNTSGETFYTQGSSIKLYYNKDDPHDVSADEPPPKAVGWIFIGVAVVVAIIAWVWVWLTRKYKAAAAFQGMGSGLSIMTGGRI